MIVVSYWTNDFYRAHAERLRESVITKIGTVYKDFVSCEISEMPDLGSHNANVHQKARFMLEKLHQHGQSVLWIDADAVVEDLDFLQILEERMCLTDDDLGVVYYEPPSRPEGAQLLGGTIYAAQTPGARLALEAWCLENAAHPNALDQENLDAVIRRLRVRVTKFGVKFCWLEKPMRYYYPDAKPVITHLGVSRR